MMLNTGSTVNASEYYIPETVSDSPIAEENIGITTQGPQQDLDDNTVIPKESSGDSISMSIEDLWENIATPEESSENSTILPQQNPDISITLPEKNSGENIIISEESPEAPIPVQEEDTEATITDPPVCPDGSSSDTTVDPASYNAIFDLDDTTPDDFDGKENPYMLEDNDELYFNRHHQLALYQSYDAKSDSGRIWQTWYKKWGGEGKSLDIAKNAKSDKGGFESFGDCPDPYAYSYVQSVAFDPDGIGRKDYIAFAGYDNDVSCINVWVVNTANGKYSRIFSYKTDSRWNWLGDAEYGKPDKVSPATAQGFLSITAGDYDGDKKDTIAVYLCQTDLHYSSNIAELQYDSYRKTLKEINKSSDMLNPYYTKSYFCSEWRSLADRLCCRLVTGDFNGDGIDDLAALSYINLRLDAGKHYDYDNFSLYTGLQSPYLSVRTGKITVDKGVKTVSYKTASKSVMRKEPSDTDGSDIYSSMYAAGMDAGDLDADGQDEIIIAGCGTSIKISDNILMPPKPVADKISTVIFGFNGNGGFAGAPDYKMVDTNNWTKNFYLNYAKEKEYDVILNPLSVKCVAYNGIATAKQVFINGSIYEISDEGIHKLYTPDYFERVAGSYPKNYGIISSVAAGNFDENQFGYEQIAFTVGWGIHKADLPKPSSDSKYDRLTYKTYFYAYATGMIGGKNYDGKGGSIGSKANSGSDKFYTAGSFPNNSTNQSEFKDPDIHNGRTNFVVTAVEVDDSGSKMRYREKICVYSDPEVLAVLQAAPYFGELGSNPGATTYEITQSYSFDTTTSGSLSIGIGGSAGVDVGGNGASASLKFTATIATSFKQALTNSWSKKFTATTHNIVVIQRTPVYIYCYDVYDPVTRKWGKDAGEKFDLAISVPKPSSYFELSIDEYNAFVKEYNDRMEKASNASSDPSANKWTRMKAIEGDEWEWIHDNEGNPWEYVHSLEKAGEGNYKLGYHAGSASAGASTTSSVSKSLSIQGTLSYEQTEKCKFGVITGSISQSLAFSTSRAWTTTEAKGNAISGTVANLDVDKLSNIGPKIKDDKAYGFRWSFGKTTCDVGCAGKSIKDGKIDRFVNVYGYNVYDVTGPAPAVRDLSVDIDENNNFMLTWTKPDTEEHGRKQVKGYNVYQKDSNGFALLNKDGIIPEDNQTSYSYPIVNLKDGSTAEYVVTTITYEGSKQIEGAWSNVAAADHNSNSKIKFITVDMTDIRDTWTYNGKSLSADPNDKDKDGCNYVGSASGNYIEDTISTKYKGGWEYKWYEADMVPVADDKAPDNAGEYWLRAKAVYTDTPNGKKYTGYAYKKITILPAEVSLTAKSGCKVTKVYDGEYDKGEVAKNTYEVTGVIPGDESKFKVIPDDFYDPNVGGQSFIDISLAFNCEPDDICRSNYRLGKDSRVTVPCEIMPLDITDKIIVSGIDPDMMGSMFVQGKIAPMTYNGVPRIPLLRVEYEYADGKYNDFEEGKDYYAEYGRNTNAGENAGIVLITPVIGSNYTFKEKEDKTKRYFKIEKARFARYTYDEDTGDYTEDKYPVLLDVPVKLTEAGTSGSYDLSEQLEMFEASDGNTTVKPVITLISKTDGTDISGFINLSDVKVSGYSISFKHVNKVDSCMLTPSSVEFKVSSANYEDFNGQLFIRPDESLHKYNRDEYESDDMYHWHECTACGLRTEQAEHRVNENSSETDIHRCMDCGYKLVTDKVKTPAQLRVEILDNDIIYDGTPKKPRVRVNGLNGFMLLEGDDYIIKYTNNIAANTYNASTGRWSAPKIPSIIITSKGNYTGSVTKYFDIEPLNLSGADVNAAPVVLAYTGKVQKASPVIKYNDKILKKGTDYTLSYPDTGTGAYKDAAKGGSSEYNILVTFKGNYKGDMTVKEKITRLVPMSKVKVSAIPSQKYTGKAITPEAVIKYGKTTLKKDVDYTAVYEKNIYAGTASVTFTGIEGKGYTGSVTKTFKILGSKLSGSNVVLSRTKVNYNPADPDSVCPGVAVTYGGKMNLRTLKEGDDYTVTYPDTIKKGKLKITVTGKGGYTGKVVKTFKVDPYSVKRYSDAAGSGIRIQKISDNIPYMNGGTTFSDEYLTITYKSGSTEVPLVKGKDYKLSYSNNKAVNLYDPGSNTWEKAKKKPAVKIIFTGNYKGSLTEYFGIKRQELSNISMTTDDIVRNEKAGKYTTNVVISDNGKKLKANRDYTLAYYRGKHTASGIESGEAEPLSKNDKIHRDDEYLTVYAKAKGNNYTGSAASIIAIKPKVLTKAKISLAPGVKKYYSGKDVKLSHNDLIVKVGGDILEYGYDYEISAYENNNAVGNATVTIAGIGDYGGSRQFKFKINARSVSLFESIVNSIASNSFLPAVAGVFAN